MSHTLLAADAATASAHTLTPGRSWSLVAIALGLGGVVLGGPALARSGRGGGAGRTRAIVALVAGLTATVIGAWVVAAARGGPGTGYGIVGGWVALVVGAAAAILGGPALVRSRRRSGVPGAARVTAPE